MLESASAAARSFISQDNISVSSAMKFLESRLWMLINEDELCAEQMEHTIKAHRNNYGQAAADRPSDGALHCMTALYHRQILGYVKYISCEIFYIYMNFSALIHSLS